MRLIDADALVERTEILDYVFVVNWTTKKVQSLINAAPTVDAVPVVRCKDCKRFSACEEVEGVSWTGYCNYGEFHTDDEDFCSRGERRSDD